MNYQKMWDDLPSSNPGLEAAGQISKSERQGSKTRVRLKHTGKTGAKKKMGGGATAVKGRRKWSQGEKRKSRLIWGEKRTQHNKRERRLERNPLRRIWWPRRCQGGTWGHDGNLGPQVDSGEEIPGEHDRLSAQKLC